MFQILEPYTVSFFGHRRIEGAVQLEEALEQIVSRLLREKEFVEFLVAGTVRSICLPPLW